MASIRSGAALSAALLLALTHSAAGFTSHLALGNAGLVSSSSCINRFPLRSAARGTRLQLQMQDSETKAPEEKEDMMTKVKNAGIAGLITYTGWEILFWTVSAPTAIIIYHQTTGEWPSFSNPESTAKVSAVIFGFLGVHSSLLPVRIALTLATIPLVDKYVVKPFGLGKKAKEEEA